MTNQFYKTSSSASFRGNVLILLLNLLHADVYILADEFQLKQHASQPPL